MDNIFIRNTDDYNFYDKEKYSNIENSIVIKVEKNTRADLLAKIYYGDEKKYWIIMRANSLDNIYIEANSIIYIPKN